MKYIHLTSVVILSFLMCCAVLAGCQEREPKHVKPKYDKAAHIKKLETDRDRCEAMFYKMIGFANSSNQQTRQMQHLAVMNITPDMRMFNRFLDSSTFYGDAAGGFLEAADKYHDSVNFWADSILKIKYP